MDQKNNFKKNLNKENKKLALKTNSAKSVFHIKDSIKKYSENQNTTKNNSKTKNINTNNKKPKKRKKIDPPPLQITNISKPIWLSVSEAAKLGGVQDKTIRRAIQSKTITYKVVNNRYAIELASLIKFLYSRTKLKNKLNYYGIGQYINKWKD